jgi:NTP pyrophosphatase (non-canonical NTP hydrolase)
MQERQAQTGGFTTEYDSIEIINAWLDRSHIDQGMTQELDDMTAVFKIQEEAGEAAEAYLGMIGENPRKGTTHTEDDVLDELADVAVAALRAIQHFTRSKEHTALILRQKLDAIKSRAGL